MKNKKITIKNYDKDLNKGIFYGWDIISADETDEQYLFQLMNRADNKLRMYISLGRDLQIAPQPYFEPMHQVYITDDDYNLNYTGWFRAHDLTYKNFWDVVEDIADKNFQTPLPF